MLRSLRARLLLLTLPVAIISVLATAFVTQRTTRAEFNDALQRDLTAEGVIFENLGNYAAVNGTWDGSDRLLRTLFGQYQQRIVITDDDGTVIADTEEIMYGRRASVPLGSPLLIEPAHPLFATGYTDVQLDVLRASVRRTLECLDENQIAYEDAADDEYLAENITIDWSDPAMEETIRGCLSSSELTFTPSLSTEETFVERPINFVGNDFPVAKLFFGETSPATAETGIAWRLAIAVAGVLFITVAAALAVSQRILRPVTALTTAAQRMEDGHFDERVPVRRDDELGNLGRAFNSMSESLEHSISLRRRMTSDVAHELRTPISNIRGYLEAAQDGVAPLTPQLVDSLYEDTIHLQQLVEDLQEISIADAGQIRLERQLEDLDHLVQHAITAHQPRAISEGIVLNQGNLAGGRVEMDARRVRQVLVNLIENAIRYTDRGGIVTVSCSRRQGAALVSVADTGTGIGAKHLPHIFDRFYRADESRSRETGGTGLGLAIAQQLITAHGGTINVESTLGRGSVFTIELPTETRARPAPPVMNGAGAPAEPASVAVGHGQRIEHRDESIVIDEVIHLDRRFSER